MQCENCKLLKNGECIGGKEDCEYFEQALANKESYTNWPLIMKHDKDRYDRIEKIDREKKLKEKEKDTNNTVVEVSDFISYSQDEKYQKRKILLSKKGYKRERIVYIKLRIVRYMDGRKTIKYRITDKKTKESLENEIGHDSSNESMLVAYGLMVALRQMTMQCHLIVSGIEEKFCDGYYFVPSFRSYESKEIEELEMLLNQHTYEMKVQ